MTQYPSQGSRSSKAEDAIVNSGVVSVLVAAMLAAFYLVTSIYIGSHRLFWYDEIVTVHIAGLPNLATILDALAHGADGMPPGYYTLATAVQRLIGASEVAARLTSALAMAAGLLITFDCARRLTDGLHRLVGLAVLSCSFLPYYGYEARSYAIYFMLAAISFWIWTCTPPTTGDGPRLHSERCFSCLPQFTTTLFCSWCPTDYGNCIAGNHGAVLRQS